MNTPLLFTSLRAIVLIGLLMLRHCWWACVERSLKTLNHRNHSFWNVSCSCGLTAEIFLRSYAFSHVENKAEIQEWCFHYFLPLLCLSRWSRDFTLAELWTLPGWHKSHHPPFYHIMYWKYSTGNVNGCASVAWNHLHILCSGAVWITTNGIISFF